MKIAIIGSGIAGLFSGLMIKNNLKDADITIFEKNNKIGGRINMIHFEGSEVIAGAGIGRLLPKSELKATAASGSKKIIKDVALKVGENHNFVSKAGTPAVLFKTKTGSYAYSAVCTHEGCTVQYNTASKYLQCGCHGAVFDPANGAKVLGGPTNTPLAKIKIATDGAWIVES